MCIRDRVYIVRMLAFCQVNVLNEYDDDDDDLQSLQQSQIVRVTSYTGAQRSNGKSRTRD